MVEDATAPAVVAGEQDGAVTVASEEAGDGTAAVGENPQQQQPICRHWERMGSCLYEERCRFRHDGEGGGGAAAAAAAGGGGAGAGGGAAAGGGTKPNKKTRHHARNRGKAGAFRRWLINTFGINTLRGDNNNNGGDGNGERGRDGEGVLDIAGGKGELAFELLNISGVPVTVIDPRPMRLDKYVKTFRKGFYHRNKASTMDAGGCARRPMGSALTAPRHLRIFFHAGIYDASPGTLRAAVRESWELANNTRWSCRGLVGVGGDGDGDGDGGDGVKGDEGGGASSGRHAEYMRKGEGAPLRQRTAFSATATTTEAETATTTATAAAAPEAGEGAIEMAPEEEEAEPAVGQISNDGDCEAAADADACEPAALDAAATAAALEALLERCTVVVGLHTDQATDAAVDYALSRGKPFAVVPCCTYSLDFPHRRRPPGPDNPKGGGAVTTHAHLVEYLLAKAPVGLGHFLPRYFAVKTH
jgi:hypothetical protein